MDANFTVFGLGRPSQEAKMAALAIYEGRIIYTSSWKKDSSFRVVLHHELKRMRPAFGHLHLCAVSLGPNLHAVAGGLTTWGARAKLSSYLTPERINDLATDAETRYRPTSGKAETEWHDVDAHEGAAEIQGSSLALEGKAEDAGPTIL